jgi:CheY-like chemotaxis protein
MAVMAKTGPIILVEDDPDDKEIFEDIVRDLGIANKITWFTNSRDTFSYLKTTPEQPFLIFCDVNLPKQNGLTFKKQIDDDEQLRRKSIPFVFFSTSANQSIVNEAYTKMTVQGFFKKANNYSGMKDLVKIIVDYWQACKHPNTD